MYWINQFGYRPASRPAETGTLQSGGSVPSAGFIDTKDFDFDKTEMKYDSTGMFHWCPARIMEDCSLVNFDDVQNTLLIVIWLSILGQKYSSHDCTEWTCGKLNKLYSNSMTVYPN